MFGNNPVYIKVGGIRNIPPSDNTEGQQEPARRISIAVLVLGAEPSRLAVREVEHVSLAIGRVNGDVPCRVVNGGPVDRAH